MSDGTVRVSAREIEETTRWAFIASGCSAGEAAVAGRVVRRAELHLGCGVDAANTELTHHRFSDEPIRHHPGPIETIEDEHGRGLLTLGPLATMMAATRGTAGTAVVINGVRWHPVMAAILIEGLRSSGSTSDGVAAWPAPAGVAHHLTIDDPPGCRLIGHADAAIATAPRPEPAGPEANLPGPDRASPNQIGAAVVIVAVAGPPANGWPNRSARMVPAGGVEVDAASWGQLYRAAEGFLVSDS